jgi:hypothetical protein
MKKVGVYEAKTHLPRLLDEVERGETIDVTRHRRPHRQDLAREQGLTAYDTACLDLAMREGLPLATRDIDLIAAA